MAKEGNKNMMIDVTWKLPKRSEVREAMVSVLFNKYSSSPNGLFTQRP